MNADRYGDRVLFKATIFLLAIFISAVWGILLQRSILISIVLVIGIMYLLVLFFRPFWATLAFIFTSAFGPFLNLPVTSDGFLLSLAILFTAFLVLVTKALLTKDRDLFIIPLRSGVHLYLVGFLLIMAVSMINSSNVAASLAQIKRFTYCVVIYFYVIYSVKEKDQLKKLFAVMLIGYFLVSLLGVMEAISGQRIYEFLGGKSLLGGSLPAAVLKISEKARIQGVMGNAEFHSFRMLSFLFFSLCTLFILKSKKQKMAISVLLLLGIANLIGTAYRGAIIAFGVSLLIFFVLSKFHQKWLIFSLSISSLVLLAFSFYLIFPDLNIERLVKTEGKAVETVNMRKNNVIIGFNMALAHPIIGNGPDGFILKYNRYKRSFPEARLEEIKTHNTYVQVLAEYGIMGLTAFLLILFIPIKNLYRTYKKADDQAGYLILSILAVLSAYVTLMGGANVLLDHNFWLILAIAGIMERIYGHSNERKPAMKTSLS